jgi:HEAT repeat protein
MADHKSSSPEQFLDALDRMNLDQKRVLIDELGTHPSERSIKILAEILQGDSWYLRDLAVDSMSQMGDHAIPVVNILLYSGLWYTRASAARCLGKMQHFESLPDLVHLLGDPNRTVQSACLASIADFVRAGVVKETTRQFWNQGARRAQDLSQMLRAVYPDAGNAVAEMLSDPASFLREDVPEEEPKIEVAEVEVAEVEQKKA